MTKKMIIGICMLVLIVGCNSKTIRPKGVENFDSLIQLINEEEDVEMKLKLQKSCFIIVYNNYGFTDDNPETKVLSEMIINRLVNTSASEKAIYAYDDLLRCTQDSP